MQTASSIGKRLNQRTGMAMCEAVTMQSKLKSKYKSSIAGFVQTTSASNPNSRATYQGLWKHIKTMTKKSCVAT